MTEEPGRRTVSRLGTARALVLLAAALSFGASALVSLLALVFGWSVLDRHGLTGSVVLATAVCCLVVLVSAVAACLLAVRAGTVGRVVGRGCGTLLAGVVTGLAALFLLISRNA